MTRLLTLTMLLAAVAVSNLASALEIRVTGHSQLEVSASAAGTIAQVAGALRDDLNRGLPQRDVLVQIDARRTGETLVSRTVRTDSLGRFGVQEELPPGDYEVFVRFDKTEHLDAIAESMSITLAPAPVTMRAFAPALVFRREHPAWLSARATAAQTPYQGWAEVYVEGSNVGRLEFDASGRGTFDLTPHLVVGFNDVRLRTPASNYRDEATAEVTVRFADAVTFTADLDERVERLQRGVALTGTLHDEVGPLENVRIVGTVEALELYDQQATTMPTFSASSTTKKDGRYVVFLPGARVADGVWRGKAELVPPLGARLEVDAGTLTVDKRNYRAIASGFGWLAVLLGVLMVLGRGGVSIAAWWRDLRNKRAARAREVAALEEVETIVPVFLDDGNAPPSPNPRDDIGGLVWDVWQQQPIRHARVVIRRGDTVLADGTSDGAGRFAFIDLTEGPIRVEVTCHGFIRGHVDLMIPHDGRLSNFRVDLVAVPLKIRRLVGAVLEQALGEDAWGTLTPREIEARLDALWPNDGRDAESTSRDELRAQIAQRLGDQNVDGIAWLQALTEIVEESYFSGRRYGEDAFLFARALVLAIRNRPMGGA